MFKDIPEYEGYYFADSKGKRNTAGGYIWRYVEKNQEIGKSKECTA